MLPGSETVARLIAETAAIEIMPRFAKLGKDDISEKRPGDLVTVADVAAEARLSRLLLDLLPGSRIVGEEAVAANPKILEALAGDDPVWLVDPIDGTVNFAEAKPIFAVMVALVRRGVTLMGWIHDPVSGVTASAIAGEGAWRGGERLSTARTPSPGAGDGLLWSGNRKLARKIGPSAEIIGSVFDLRCAGHEYLALASGEAHVALYHRLHPWDHAPGQLLHREAGGFSALLDGTPYVPRAISSGMLLAPDEASWRRFHALLIAAR
jgi:fructose-1,6-bisphosphatase/inositol monophosphatase family enzyme